MLSWRERLCGSIAMGSQESQAPNTLDLFLHPNETMSCGGGFYPQVQKANAANLNTTQKNYMLPKDSYSVMIFKDDGTTVIYSDEEPTAASDDAELFEVVEPEER